jgi:23S rRNA pseudouridine2457 synthase
VLHVVYHGHLIYLLLNKPYGVLCQFSPSPQGHPTLTDFVSLPNIYPAGRLDHDSEGLLLLTDDGGLQHRLTDPKFAHPRTYWAQVEGSPTPQALNRLESGVRISGYNTRHARARTINEPPDLWPRTPPIRYRANIPTSWIEITITEGRNRQVRRMTAAVGFPTLRLIRCAIGDLRVESLPPGQTRPLTAPELARLMQFRTR